MERNPTRIQSRRVLMVDATAPEMGTNVKAKKTATVPIAMQFAKACLEPAVDGQSARRVAISSIPKGGHLNQKSCPCTTRFRVLRGGTSLIDPTTAMQQPGMTNRPHPGTVTTIKAVVIVAMQATSAGKEAARAPAAASPIVRTFAMQWAIARAFISSHRAVA